MSIVAVANTKGGTGKSTLACHLAAAFAQHGRVTLVDLDRQGCAAAFVRKRPRSLAPIHLARDLGELRGGPAVVDLPAGKRTLVDEAVRHVDAIFVPVMPSLFDEVGLAMFLDRLDEQRAVRKGEVPVFVVANRVKPGTLAEGRLEAFLRTLHVPLVATVHDRQEYANATASGVTCFDAPSARARGCRDDLAPLLDAVQSLTLFSQIAKFPNANRRAVG